MNTNFKKLLIQIDTILLSGKNKHETLSEICILLKTEVYHYDWVGFYILDKGKNKLILGPFCGKPTEHTEIPVGKGVCGQVAESKKLKIVQDVKLEGNYIACSLDVQSEIVVPVVIGNEFVAEIDIDSHSPAPFSTEDEKFLTAVCQKIERIF